MGKLIVIEGLDGSGKATQVELLHQKLSSMSTDVKILDFPCYDDTSSVFVKMYLNGEFGDKAEDVGCYGASMFYAVDRYVSFLNRWGTDYKKGVSFIANRYTTSNAVHQMAKLNKDEWDEYLNWLFDFEYNRLSLPAPDVVIYLDVAPNVSKRLLIERYSGNKGKMDIHEKDIDYQLKCREAAIFCCENQGWQRINCTTGEEIRSRDDIAKDIYDMVKQLF